MEAKTKLALIPFSRLSKAPWNYKSEGTPEQIAKLAESIKEDSSAGVLAVREIGKDKYEVIDGNHRLDAIEQVGWKQVPCENFGKISKARAVLVARRRNYQWFEDDKLKLASLIKDEVLKEFSMEELERFMPETKDELESLVKLLDFDWTKFKTDGSSSDETDEDHSKLVLRLNADTMAKWLEWKERCRKLLGYDVNEKCFEFAVAEALNIPEESLR